MEIFATETTYVENLETAVRVFLKPMKALFGGRNEKERWGGGVGKFNYKIFVFFFLSFLSCLIYFIIHLIKY